MAAIHEMLERSDREVVLWIDFGGVISPSVGGSASGVAHLLGATWPEVYAASDDFARTLGTTGLGPLELGLLSQDAWVDEVLERLGSSLRADRLPERFEDVWYRGRGIDEEFYRALLGIRGSGVSMGVLTNSVAEWEQPRRRMVDLDTDFDAVVRSHVVGLMKPDPGIFAYAQRQLGGLGALHVLVDDLERNCVGARAVGWEAIHHADEVPIIVPAMRSELPR